jgi:hypothetical protein
VLDVHDVGEEQGGARRDEAVEAGRAVDQVDERLGQYGRAEVLALIALRGAVDVRAALALKGQRQQAQQRVDDHLDARGRRHQFEAGRCLSVGPNCYPRLGPHSGRRWPCCITHRLRQPRRLIFTVARLKYARCSRYRKTTSPMSPMII